MLIIILEHFVASGWSLVYDVEVSIQSSQLSLSPDTKNAYILALHSPCPAPKGAKYRHPKRLRAVYIPKLPMCGKGRGRVEDVLSIESLSTVDLDKIVVSHEGSETYTFSTSQTNRGDIFLEAL